MKSTPRKVKGLNPAETMLETLQLVTDLQSELADLRKRVAKLEREQ